MVQYALLSADAVDCAKRILLSRGGRSAAEVNEFFESVADSYINDLLQKKQLDRAKDVISNTVRFKNYLIKIKFAVILTKFLKNLILFFRIEIFG